MIDIAPLGIKNVTQGNTSLLTLKEYIKIAKILIFKLCPKYLGRLGGEVLKSEDVISNIATQIMIADWQWNGNGTLYGYRKQRVIWALLHLTKRNKRYIFSLNYVYFDNEELGNLIIDKNISIEEHAIKKENIEIVKTILNSFSLSSRQKHCIKFRFYENMTLQEIGNKLGISKEAVRKNINKAKIKIRKLIYEHTT